MFNLAEWEAIPALLDAVHWYNPPSWTSTRLIFTWLTTSPCTVTYCPIRILKNDSFFLKKKLPTYQHEKKHRKGWGFETETSIAHQNIKSKKYVEIWFLCSWRKFFKCTSRVTQCYVLYDTVSKNWFWARFSDNQVSEYPKDSLSSLLLQTKKK